MNRLEPAIALQRPAAPGRREPLPVSPDETGPTPGSRIWTFLWLIAFAIVVGGFAAVAPGVEWESLLVREEPSPPVVARPPADSTLSLPRRGEAALERARAFSQGGHLREAIAALDRVSATDPERPDADQLRARIQRELLALTSTGSSGSGVARGKSDGTLP